MTFSCGARVWGVDWKNLVGVGVCIKKPRGSLGLENMHVWYYLSDSEGSRTRAQRLGGVKRERRMNDIFVWGEGVGSWLNTFGWGAGVYKKNQGVIGSGNMHVWYYFSDSEGSRTRAQRLGEVKREKKEWHFRVRGGCGELTGFLWLGWGCVKKTQGVILNVLYIRLMLIYSEYPISNIETTWYWSIL